MAGPNLSGVVAAADFTTIAVAVVAVGALAVGMWLAVVGVRKIIRLIRSDGDDTWDGEKYND
jgi:hypothetical protein